jgi:uncharacterized YigZ family protein
MKRSGHPDTLSTMPTYRTIAAPLRYEIEKIKGSRFIATAEPVRSREEARAAVDALRAEMPDATHHCHAWRITADETHFSDDGEPSGSAGRPILRQIEGADLVQVAVIVTRYFGGTKLGTGGLVRAYAAAAKAVLESARIVEHRLTRLIEITHDYEITAAVNAILSAHHLEPIESTYDEHVRFRVSVPVEEVEPFIKALREATADRAEIRPLGDDPK